MKLLRATAVVACFALPGISRAESPAPEEVAVLRQQVREMRARLDEMEKVLARLETPPAESAPVAHPVAAPPAEGPRFSEAAGRLHFHISGFADVTGVYRSTFTGATIQTPFATIPLENTPEARLGEFRGAANHSRLNFRFDTRLGDRDLDAYVETDFLGNVQPNVFAGSNSHTLRLRLYWARLRNARWELLGGQSWSLLAPNRSGISPVPADVMSTRLIDPNYSVGLVWTRQGTIRITRHFGRWHLAGAVENPEQSILDSQELGQDVRGLGTRTAPGSNIRPDLTGKVAYDASFAHFEVAGLARNFHVYSTALGRPDQALGGGVSLASVIHAGPRIDIVSQDFFSAGGGRYLQAVIPDVTVRPDGRLVRITSYSLLHGVEAKLSDQVTTHVYYGLVYGKRAAYEMPGRGFAGFGAPRGSALDDRTVSQTSVGFRHTLWRQEGYGALSYGLDYSYLVRKLWQANPAGNLGRAHMLYTNFRYNLP